MYKVAFASAVLLFSVQAAAQPSTDGQVRETAAAFVSAWNSHDMERLASLFAKDAQFVNVVGTWWKDRAQIEQAHVASHKTMFKDSKLSGSVTSIKYLRPDVAVAHMPWQLTGARTPTGKPVPLRKGILMFVLTREQQGWTIQAAQNTDVVAGVGAPPPAQAPRESPRKR